MFDNTDVNTLSITNSKRNILPNLETNDNLLHELDDNEQSSIRSSDDDTSTKKYDILQERINNILECSGGIEENLLVNSDEESSIEFYPISTKNNVESSKMRKEKEIVAEQFLRKSSHNLMQINITL